MDDGWWTVDEFNLQPSTLNPQPSTLNPQPSTLNPQPSTFNLQPSTINHQPNLYGTSFLGTFAQIFKIRFKNERGVFQS